MSQEEKLDRLVTDVAVIKEQMKNFIEGQKDRGAAQMIMCSAHKDKLSDHEARIRKNEEFKSKTLGVIVAIQVFLTLLIGVMIKYL